MAYLAFLIGILWIIFWMYWLISSFSAKRTIRGRNWVYGALIRVVFLVVIIVLVNSLHVGNFFVNQRNVSSSLWLEILGTILVIAGLGFAVWARVHLGKNWGMPMSMRENPELVTSGPYRLVRHPIYTGILCAVLGTICVVGVLIWLYVLIFFAIYFIFSATREEKLMSAKFPDQYPMYKNRTKMLIPYIF